MFTVTALAFMLLNFGYFAICFFGHGKQNDKLQYWALIMTLPLLIQGSASLFESFNALQTATPLQLMHFVSCVFMFVAAGKYLVQRQWLTLPKREAALRENHS